MRGRSRYARPRQVSPGGGQRRSGVMKTAVFVAAIPAAVVVAAVGLALLPFVALVWLADRSMRSHSRADLRLPLAQEPDSS